jgi:branched-chain amino acid transport system substrate-binding protein
MPTYFVKATMAKFKGFGHPVTLLLCLFVLIVSGCTTVPTPQNGNMEQEEYLEILPEGPTEGTALEDQLPQPVETNTKKFIDKLNQTEPPQGVSQDPIANPPYNDKRKISLLLPFSSKSSRLREEAASMLKAAELAIFDLNKDDILLSVHDTSGTTQGAEKATKSAIDMGADLIIGPILANSVKISSAKAKQYNVPIIAFSSDIKVASKGIYLLSFPPESEINRLVNYAASKRLKRYAYLGPESRYGLRVQKEFVDAVINTGGEITGSETYTGNDIAEMQEPAKKLADFYVKGVKKIRKNNGRGLMSYDAILLPEGGTSLLSLAPLLPYFDVDPTKVQFLGTSLWKNEETVREPALNGGIFAAADDKNKVKFFSDYEKIFAEEPSRLAPLAYDALTISETVTKDSSSSIIENIERIEGFYGIDGLVRFGNDGIPERGLAIYKIENGRFKVISPAPKSFSLELN